MSGITEIINSVYNHYVATESSVLLGKHCPAAAIQRQTPAACPEVLFWLGSTHDPEARIPEVTRPLQTWSRSMRDPAVLGRVTTLPAM